MSSNFEIKKLYQCIEDLTNDLYTYKKMLNSYKFLFTCIANDFFFKTYNFLKEQL